MPSSHFSKKEILKKNQRFYVPFSTATHQQRPMCSWTSAHTWHSKLLSSKRDWERHNLLSRRSSGRPWVHRGWIYTGPTSKKKMQIQPPASWSTFKYTDVVKHPGNWMNSLPHNKTQAWRKDSLASAVCPGCPISPGWAENYISLPGKPESRWKGGTGSCPLNLIS